MRANGPTKCDTYLLASSLAGVGRVRKLAFLSILRGALLLSQACGPLSFYRVTLVFLQFPTS